MMMNNSMKWSLVPVKVEHVDAYTYSQAMAKSNKLKSGERRVQSLDSARDLRRATWAS